MLWSGIVAGTFFGLLGLVMVLLPNRDTPYGVRRREFGVTFCLLGPLVAVLSVIGVPLGSY